MNAVVRLESISQVHEALGLPKPLHPLISFVDFSRIESVPAHLMNVSVVTSLYSVALKKGCAGELVYGRGTYDFEEGALVFLGPDQLIEHRGEPSDSPNDGWGLYFHPDLIRGHAIGENLDDYGFFEYEVSEALHLSDKEKSSLETVVSSIVAEYEQNPDDFSLEIILTNLELFLGYCKRFYSRQFSTRKAVNQTVARKFSLLLKDWFGSDAVRTHGIPTVGHFSRKLGYSPNYLGDLLKKETGKSTRDHIHGYIIEQAKAKLLNRELNIAQVAYELGFEYPHHFSTFFKKKTGMTPNQWRS